MTGGMCPWRGKGEEPGKGGFGCSLSPACPAWPGKGQCVRPSCSSQQSTSSAAHTDLAGLLGDVFHGDKLFLVIFFSDGMRWEGLTVIIRAHNIDPGARLGCSWHTGTKQRPAEKCQSQFLLWCIPTAFTCRYFYLNVSFCLFTRTKAKHSQPRAASFARSTATLKSHSERPGCGGAGTGGSSTARGSPACIRAGALRDRDRDRERD